MMWRLHTAMLIANSICKSFLKYETFTFHEHHSYFRKDFQMLLAVKEGEIWPPHRSLLGEIDGLHGTSTQSCILTYDLCTGEPLRRPKPAQDEWYVIMSGHPFIKALAAYWGGASVQGLRCHFISMPGKSPMKLEVTSRHDHSCLLGRKASKQTNKQN